MALGILVLLASVVALIASLVMAARGERATGALIAGTVAVIGMVVGILTWIGFVYFLLLLLALAAIILGFMARREGGRATAGIVLGALTAVLFIVVQFGQS